MRGLTLVMSLCTALSACKESPKAPPPPPSPPPTQDARINERPPTPIGYGPVDELLDTRDMVAIPEGVLQLETIEAHMDAFYLDRFEVTVARYRECVNLGACRAPRPRKPIRESDTDCVADLGTWSAPDHDDHPITCIDAADAYAYCLQRGKRLPAPGEWRYAARGTDRRKYPWGDREPTCTDLAVRSAGDTECKQPRTRPVGTTKLDVSPFGVHDLAGNVAEFVLGKMKPPPLEHDDKDWTIAGDGITAVVILDLEQDVGSWSRASPGTGFRCAVGGRPY